MVAMDTDHHVDRPAAALDTFVGISNIVRLGVPEEESRSVGASSFVRNGAGAFIG